MRERDFSQIRTLLNRVAPDFRLNQPESGAISEKIKISHPPGRPHARYPTACALADRLRLSRPPAARPAPYLAINFFIPRIRPSSERSYIGNISWRNRWVWAQ